MSFTASSPVVAQLPQPFQRRINFVPSLFQSMNIRYELCSRTGDLVALYRDGYSVAGYDTIDQFYADMATAGWQVDSTQQACSCSLHFSVLKRDL